MAFYSDNNVKTRIIDPRIYVPGRRATFELDASEAAYLPNLRLAVLGGTSNPAHSYSRLVGCAALIRSIRLLDGKQELCALNEAQFYRGFQQQNKANSSAESVASNLNCTGIGLSVNGTNGKIARIAKTASTDTPANVANTDTSLIDLKEMLPFLAAMTHLPTALFTNLRLEIEMDDNILSQVLVVNNVLLNTVRPVLIVDVLENPKVVNKLNKGLGAVQWAEVEHDQFVIPQSAADGATAADQGIVQEVNVKLNGFNNKILDRLLIVKEISDPLKEIDTNAVQGYGKWSSQGCYKQTIQYRVNGSNILPRNGIVGNNERLAYVVDTYGECANYPGSNIYGMDTSDVMDAGRQYRAQLDYIGIFVGQYIQDLQIEYSRTGLHDTDTKRATTSALIAHCYGEVRKSFQLTGNGMYNIGYVQQ